MTIVNDALFAARFLDAGGWVYNVKHPAYAASGDGQTDDTEAIQSAIDGAPREGAVVAFPPGVYRVTDTIRVRKPVSLVGAGPETSTLIKGDDGDRPVVRLGDIDRSYQGMSIRDLGIEGSSDGRGDCLECVNVTEGDNYIQNLRLRRGAWGLTLYNTFGLGIRDCRIGLNVSGAIRGIGAATGGSTNQITLVNCFVKLNGGPALDIPMGKWTVVGGAYENPAASAPLDTDNIRIRAAAYSVSLIGVCVESADRNNIRVTNEPDGEVGTPRVVSLRDCYINNVTETGGALVHVGHARNVLIDQCFFDGNDPPVRIRESAQNVTIRGMLNETSLQIEGAGDNVRIG